MIINKEALLKELNALDNTEFLEVNNPGFVRPAKAFYPMAPALTELEAIDGILMDMDGTTTTTEDLCLYSLEQMVRKTSKVENWTGLSPEQDYPHVIGNSTTKHVEYLLKTYEAQIDVELTKSAFIQAAKWTLTHGEDANRIEEVKLNIRKLGFEPEDLETLEASQIQDLSFDAHVALSIDIYYVEYHQLLALLKQGKDDQVKELVFGDASAAHHVISPMPGIPFFLPFIKGMLGAEAGLFTQELIDALEASTGEKYQGDLQQAQTLVASLGEHFAQHPVKLGLVTSSIAYEAEIVIDQVLKIVRETMEASDLSPETKARIQEKFAHKTGVYDAFVNASDTHEIKLKPHPDLYSIALYQTGIKPENFDKVMAFEDSKSGSEAIRAAGIGCCVAVPFAHTHKHDLSAAAVRCNAGLPEMVLINKMCLKNN